MVPVIADFSIGTYSYPKMHTTIKKLYPTFVSMLRVDPLLVNPTRILHSISYPKELIGDLDIKSRTHVKNKGYVILGVQLRSVVDCRQLYNRLL